MPAASILIKPSSSNCNIDCSYCFYKKLCHTRESYSLGRMSEETLEKLIKNAFEYADGFVSFAFQGGEPMLAGLDFYKKAVELEKKYARAGITVENTIQTNGMLIDDEWAEFFSRENFLVGVSLDGPRKLHDAYRKNASGGETFSAVMAGIDRLKEHNVNTNIATVVTEQVSSRASYLYKFYKRNRFSYVQVIPCMGNTWETNGSIKASENEYSIRPLSYGRFLCELFDLWYDDFVAGEDMEIRTFSNLAQMAAGFPAEECGMNGCCTCYFVTEADGSVYPCDFYCVDQWKLGDVDRSFTEMSEHHLVKEFIDESRNVPGDCRACSYFRLCRGGCRHWREPDTGLNYFCEGYKMFFSHCEERIDHLGRMVLQNVSGR